MAADQEPSAKTADILVVDDSIASLRLLTEILTQASYKVRPIERPESALKTAYAQPPDLILLDVTMPKMNGFEVCRRLKNDERTRDVPVIFVSGMDELQDRIRGFEVGGVDYIVKPIQEAEVLARVKPHLRLRDAQLHLEKLVAERTAELEKLLKERSEALNSAKAQIESLFDNSPMGIAVSTFGGQLLTVNKALLNMLRISEEELLQEGAAEFYADPADRKAMLAELQESGTTQEFGVQLVRKDGEFFFGSVNMSRLVLEGNDVMLTLVEDVTDEIMAEQEAAVLEERERLARDLHDAVTQTLYSANVLAQIAPRLLENNLDGARQNMEQVASLVRGALAEMRTLLFELGPNEMSEQNLSQMFELLAESTRARMRANVTLDIDGSYFPPEDVAMAYYRIAQESLNNIVKHSLAGKVIIDLAYNPQGAILSIKDDGRGFDPQSILTGHLGISIMRQRARNIGAEIEIESEMGGGTQVIVTWSASRNESD